METEDPLEDQLEVDRALLSKSSMQTVMMVHQQLCLNFARSLWYQKSLPSHQAKNYFTAFISCYQTGAFLVSQYYPLIGKIASNISDVQVQLCNDLLQINCTANHKIDLYYRLCAKIVSFFQIICPIFRTVLQGFVLFFLNFFHLLMEHGLRVK